MPRGASGTMIREAHCLRRPEVAPTTEKSRARVHPSDVFAHDHGDRRSGASAGGLIYGTLQWSRRRRGPTQAVREASTRELYREGAKAEKREEAGKAPAGEKHPASRRACDRSAMASAICLARVRLPALSWRYVAHPGGSFGDWRAYARRYSILTASGIFRRRRAPGLGLAGRVLRSQLIQSPFANAHPRAPQDNLHPTKCKRPSS